MSNEQDYPIQAKKSGVVKRHGKLTGNGTGAPILPSGKWSQLISTATRSGVGVYALVFDKKYPELLSPSIDIVCGTTAFIHGKFSAIDVTAGTATLKTDVAGVATDLGAADVVFINLEVRNSGRNSSS